MSFSRILYFVSILIAATFVGLGLFLIFSSSLEYIPFNYRAIFASLLIAYGSFRLVSIYFKYKNSKQEEEEE